MSDWISRSALGWICFITPFALWALLTANWDKGIALMLLIFGLYLLRRWSPPIVKDVRVDRD